MFICDKLYRQFNRICDHIFFYHDEYVFIYHVIISIFLWSIMFLFFICLNCAHKESQVCQASLLATRYINT